MALIELFFPDMLQNQNKSGHIKTDQARCYQAFMILCAKHHPLIQMEIFFRMRLPYFRHQNPHTIKTRFTNTIRIFRNRIFLNRTHFINRTYYSRNGAYLQAKIAGQLLVLAMLLYQGHAYILWKNLLSSERVFVLILIIILIISTPFLLHIHQSFTIYFLMADEKFNSQI